MSLSSKNASDNLLINPLFDLWQRGVTFAAAANGQYGADRFLLSKSVATLVVTLEQDADVPATAISKYSMSSRVTTASAASLTAAEYYSMAQRIEGFNFKRMNKRNVVLSFWVKSPRTGIHCVAFQNSASNRSYIEEYTISVVNTWEKKIIKLQHDSAGTWLVDNGIGITVQWIMGMGSNYHSTKSSWLAADKLSTANQVNCASTIGNAFKITEVSLVEGLDEIPSIKLARRIEHEISLCQRYYEKTYSLSVDPATATQEGQVSGTIGSGNASISSIFKTVKRSQPTMTYYNQAGVSGSWIEQGSNAARTATDNTARTNEVGFNVSLAATVTGAEIGGHYTANSEL